MKRIFDERKGVSLYEVGNERLKVGVKDLGAAIQYIIFDGVHMTLEYADIEQLDESGTYAGATIGRVCNRTANSKMKISGRIYDLVNNEGTNQLHGGKEGFDKKMFEVLNCTSDSLELMLVSPDGDQGYPGELTLRVLFTIDKNALEIKFTAISDKDTAFSPTLHTYFNLDGEGDCLNTYLQINSHLYTPTDEKMIPDGRILEVRNSIFDFGKMKRIGQDINSSELKRTKGYDHNFILDSSLACTAYSKKTGIQLEVSSSLPCLQVYTGGFIKKARGRDGYYEEFAGCAIEPQYCPNIMNNNFLNTEKTPLLEKGREAVHTIRYEFSHTSEQ